MIGVVVEEIFYYVSNSSIYILYYGSLCLVWLVMGWWPVQGVTRLSPNDSLDRLQNPPTCHPELD